MFFVLFFVTFPYGVPGQVCHFADIISSPDFAFFLLCVQLSSNLEGGGPLMLMMALQANQKHDDDEQALNFVEPFYFWVQTVRKVCQQRTQEAKDM